MTIFESPKDHQLQHGRPTGVADDIVGHCRAVSTRRSRADSGLVPSSGCISIAWQHITARLQLPGGYIRGVAAAAQPQAGPL